MDVRPLFPKPEAMRVHRQFAPQETPLSRIGVFRSMSLNYIYHLCEVDYRISAVQDPCFHKYICVYAIVDELVEIRLRPGAFLLASDVKTCAHCLQMWNCHIQGRIPQYAFRSILATGVPDQQVDVSYSLFST
jgi:hypothetical protein